MQTWKETIALYRWLDAAEVTGSGAAAAALAADARTDHNPAGGVAVGGEGLAADHDVVAAAAGQRRAPEVLPDPFHIGRVAAEDAGRHRVLEAGGDAPLQRQVQQVQVAHAGQAGLRHHLHHHQVAGGAEGVAEEPGVVGPGQPQQRGAELPLVLGQRVRYPRRVAAFVVGGQAESIGDVGPEERLEEHLGEPGVGQRVRDAATRLWAQTEYLKAALAFGDENDCRGWLVGEANRGIAHMFQMMNEARIMVGVNGAATASVAYHEALAYARTRTQGRPLLSKDPTRPQIPIVEHADVRVLAAALSLASTGAIMVLADAPHPPAGATTLIVSLGIVTEPFHLLIVEVAVACLTLLALVINRLAGLDYPLWAPKGNSPPRQHG